MRTDRELIEMALSDLETASQFIWSRLGEDRGLDNDVLIMALRDRLDQTEPKPVAYRYWNEHNKCYFYCDNPEPADGSVYEPLYAAPFKRDWIRLTEDEIENADCLPEDPTAQNVIDFADAIEAILRKKNA